MLTIRHIHDGLMTTVPRDELPTRRAGDGYLWVDLAAPTDEEERVLDELGIHPLTVEDMRDDRHLPKSEAFGQMLALTVHGIHLEAADVEIATVELDLAVTRDLVVTFHEVALPSLEAVAGRIERTGAAGLARPVLLVHLLLDALNDVLVPFVDLLESRIDVIEQDLLADPTEGTRHDIYALQRDLIQLRRVLVPQAEVVRRLAREPVGPIEPGDQALFRDLHDDLYRMVELTESYRQLLDGAMASYRSALDDRLNAMLTTLTLVSALLLPVSVIAGIWGTNFVVLPGTQAPAGFWVMLATSALVVVAMLGWFRIKGWIGTGAERAAMERRRRTLSTVLDVPVLGEVLKVPVRGARAVLHTGRTGRAQQEQDESGARPSGGW